MVRHIAWRGAPCLVLLLGATTGAWADTEPSQIPILAQAPADAQTPAPIEEPAGVSPVQDGTDEGDSKPWWRLFIFLPVSALIGLGAALVRRTLIDRGLVSD